MKNKKDDEFFDFVEPEDHQEIAAFRDLEEKKYCKDGFESVYPSDPNLLEKLNDVKKERGEDSDKDEDEDDYNMNNSELVQVDKLEKPYILLQVPRSEK